MNTMENQRVDLQVPDGPHFFGCWDALSETKCKTLVQFFDQRQDLQSPGRVTGGQVNTSVKDSLDIRIEPVDLELEGYEIFGDYFTVLKDCYQDYCSHGIF